MAVVAASPRLDQHVSSHLLLLVHALPSGEEGSHAPPINTTQQQLHLHHSASFHLAQITVCFYFTVSLLFTSLLAPKFPSVCTLEDVPLVDCRMDFITEAVTSLLSKSPVTWLAGWRASAVTARVWSPHKASPVSWQHSAACFILFCTVGWITSLWFWCAQLPFRLSVFHAGTAWPSEQLHHHSARAAPSSPYPSQP